jgi:hypothetical protein
MDLIEIKAEIRRVSKRLDAVPKTIFEAARDYATAERDYRLELSKEITRLKAEGLAASLIADIARGNCAELKFKRDLADGRLVAAKESSRALQAELSGLQSILRSQEEV